MRAASLAVLWLCLGAAAAQSAALPAELSLPTPKAIRSEAARHAAEVPSSPFGPLTPRRVDAIKTAVAVAAAGLLLWGAALARRGRPRAHRRLRDGLLLALGVVGALCWWNLGKLHFPHYPHRSDNFHLYIGAKYFAELGYDRLYYCTALAEAESGAGRSVAGRRMRNLESNELESAAIALENPQRCKRHFSDTRWREFRLDVEWFRRSMPPRQWLLAQTDHGYNATPVWGILGIALANSGPVSERRMWALTLLDPLLLLGMWGCIVWAFGWRAACVCAVFWGTNYFAHFGWTGGGYLRQDWLAATLVSICLLRRGRSAAAGFALACAALLRIFPALLFVGLGLKALVAAVRGRALRPSPAHLRFAAGALLAAVLALPLSAFVAGRQAWLDFVENSRVHLDTPLRNHMGLKTLLSHDPAPQPRVTGDPARADPLSDWKQARRETFAGRRPAFYALAVAFLVLLARAVADREDWVATVLAIGVIPVAGELTCYYYALLLGYGLLWTERPGVGAALCALSALGWLIAGRWHFYQEIFAIGSAAVLAFVVYATVAVGFAGRRWAICRSRRSPFRSSSPTSRPRRAS
jgi:hypothetical protein